MMYYQLEKRDYGFLDAIIVRGWRSHLFNRASLLEGLEERVLMDDNSNQHLGIIEQNLIILLGTLQQSVHSVLDVFHGLCRCKD